MSLIRELPIVISTLQTFLCSYIYCQCTCVHFVDFVLDVVSDFVTWLTCHSLALISDYYARFSEASVLVHPVTRDGMGSVVVVMVVVLLLGIWCL